MSTREKVVTWWWTAVLLAVAVLGTVSVFASGLDKQGGGGDVVSGGGSGDADAVGVRLNNYSGRDTTRTTNINGRLVSYSGLDTTRTSNINGRLVSYSTLDTYRASAAGGTIAARFYSNTSYLPMVNLWRALRWKYTNYNDGGYTISNLTTIVVPTAGKYIITASGQWDALSGTDTKRMRIMVDGAQRGSINQSPGWATWGLSNTKTEIVTLGANAVVKIECQSTATNSILNVPVVAISAVNSSAVNILNYTGIAKFTATGAQTAVTGRSNSAGGIGVQGVSTYGHAVEGTSGSGYAGYFTGKFYQYNGQATFDGGAWFNAKTAVHGNFSSTKFYGNGAGLVAVPNPVGYTNISTAVNEIISPASGQTVYLNATGIAVAMNGIVWAAGDDATADGTAAKPYRTWSALLGSVASLLRGACKIFLAPGTINCSSSNILWQGKRFSSSGHAVIMGCATTLSSGRSTSNRNTFGNGTSFIADTGKSWTINAYQQNAFVEYSTAYSWPIAMGGGVGKNALTGHYETLPIYSNTGTVLTLTGQFKSAPSQTAPYWIKRPMTILDGKGTGTNCVTLDGSNIHLCLVKMDNLAAVSTNSLVETYPGTTGSVDNVIYGGTTACRGIYLNNPGGFVVNGGICTGSSLSYFCATAGGNLDITNNDICKTVYITKSGDNDTSNGGISGNRITVSGGVGVQPGGGYYTNNFKNNLVSGCTTGVNEAMGSNIRFSGGNKFTGNTTSIQLNGALATFAASAATIYTTAGQTGLSGTNNSTAYVTSSITFNNDGGTTKTFDASSVDSTP